MPPGSTEITCTFRFEAAHHLPWHPGKCRGVHGHSYRLDVTVVGPLDAHGIVVDFDELRATVDRAVVGVWDHRDLNEIVPNPTAELLVRRAWEILEAEGLPLGELRLWETPDAWATLRAAPGGG